METESFLLELIKPVQELPTLLGDLADMNMFQQMMVDKFTNQRVRNNATGLSYRFPRIASQSLASPAWPHPAFLAP